MGKKQIFVVDDDSAIREILYQILIHENYRVHTFASGLPAVANAVKEKPNVVLLDYFLPGENTEETIRNLRKIGKIHMAIILLSANRDISKLVKELPINEFIPKPFQRESILAAIKRSIQ